MEHLNDGKDFLFYLVIKSPPGYTSFQSCNFFVFVIYIINFFLDVEVNPDSRLTINEFPESEEGRGHAPTRSRLPE